MKTILFTTRNNPKAKTISKLIEAAQRLGLNIEIIHTKETIHELHNSTKILNHIDFAIHRDFDCSPVQSFYVNQLPSATRQLNKEFLLKFHKYDKTIQYSYLSQNNLNIPLIPTVWSFDTLNYEDICKYFQNTKFLVKPSSGSFGNGIQIIDSQLKLDEYYKTHKPYNILFQKYIPIEWDIRVLIIGKQVLGAMKRNKPNKESIVTNISQGGIGEQFKLSPEIEMLALDVANILSLEYAGIDILFDSDNKPYVIEVNSNPQFYGFNKTFNIKVEDLLLEYLISTKE
ncbi:MAG: ATP-grasp domain-containing protein [Candidatus Paceibacterota bacterium]